MKRLGQFWASKHLVEEEEDNEMARVFMLLAFVPVRVNYFWEREAYQYLGHSPRFRELGVNEQTPEYNIVIHGEFSKERKRMVPVRVEAVEYKPTPGLNLEMLNALLGRKPDGNEKQPG